MGRLESRQRVRTRDGAGTVVGLYRTETPTVLVQLDRGGLHQFLPEQLQPATL